MSTKPPGTTTVFRTTKPKARYLMVINRGPGAVAIAREGHKWDLMEIYFKQSDIDRVKANPSSTDAEHIVFETDRNRRKFHIVKTAFETTGIWKEYDAVMLADDDVEPVGCTMHDIFEFFMQTGARIGQPALTQDSYFAHFLTVKNDNFQWRRTNHIDFMCIMMTRDAIAEYMPIFDEILSGFGLDQYWGYHEWRRGTAHAVLDRTPMRHSRPIGGGEGYQGIKNPMEECKEFLERHQIPPYPFLMLQGIFAREPMQEDLDLGMALTGYSENILRSQQFFHYAALMSIATRNNIRNKKSQ